VAKIGASLKQKFSPVGGYTLCTVMLASLTQNREHYEGGTYSMRVVLTVL